ADHLRHADAGPAARARIAVGHVGGGRLAMYVQPLDVGAALHHGEGLAQHRGYVEHVRDAIALEHVRQAFGARHFPVVSEHHSLPHSRLSYRLCAPESARTSPATTRHRCSYHRSRDRQTPERSMKTSTDRILTTHTGSLPRPKPLVDLILAREQGRTID